MISESMHWNSSNSNDGNGTMPSLADMPNEVAVEILSYLTLKDLGSCHHVCKSMHTACLDPLLWKGLANKIYGSGIVNATGDLYPSYKAMVINDNELGAMPTLDTGIIPSRYLFNHPDYFFICLIIWVKYHRPSNTVRVYIDARGETDLRHPGDSTLERKPLDYHGNFDPVRADGPRMRGRFIQDDIKHAPIPGHYKGYIAYDASNFSRKGRYYFTFTHTRTLFCNVDYSTVQLLAIREENGLAKAFADRDGKVQYTGMASPFEDESEVDEKDRFRKFVGNDVLDRHLTRGGRNWWV